MDRLIVSKSTDDVAKHRQVEYWNEVVSDIFTSMEVNPSQPSQFDARLHKAQLSQIGISQVQSAASRICHSKSQISRETTPLFLLHLQLKGTSVNRQDGREAVLTAGDYTLCDSTRPYELSFTDPTDILVLRFPSESLRAVLESPEDFTCVHRSGELGMSAVTSSMLNQIWRCREQALDGMPQQKLEKIVLDTVAVSYADICQQRVLQSSVQHSRRIRVVQFIEDNLDNPQLTPQLIADAFDISPRYLHQLFKGQDETVAQYILRRRLESAKGKLEDAMYGGKTISEIAYSLGFNNMTHFGRVFKERYGVTPKSVR